MQTKHAIKLVLTDLDGTLVLQETDNISPAVLAALQSARERGLAFAAVTGRPYAMTKDLLQKAGFTGPCVFEGGAQIINTTTEEVLWSRTIPVETVRSAALQLAKHASIMRYHTEVVQGRDVRAEDIVSETHSIWGNVPVEAGLDLATELATLPKVAVHVNAGPGGDFSRMGIQITHHEADKEHAVRELLQILNVDKSLTMAIGDGDNDLPLFRGASAKVAMGNASDRLKAAADRVVTDVAHDGFAEAINSI